MVNKLEFEYMPDDKIFKLEKKCIDAELTKKSKLKTMADGQRKCGVCRDVIDKKVKQCNFCGTIGC